MTQQTGSNHSELRRIRERGLETTEAVVEEFDIGVEQNDHPRTPKARRQPHAGVGTPGESGVVRSMKVAAACFFHTTTELQV
jgi:hypothetical protein